jgi:hypothetical protein
MPDESYQLDLINNFDCSFFNDNKITSEINSTLPDIKHQLSLGSTSEEDYLFENDSLDIVEKSLLNDDVNINEMMDDLLKMDDETNQSLGVIVTPQDVRPISEPSIERKTKTVDFKLIEEKLKQRLLNRSGKVLNQHEHTSFFFSNKFDKKSKTKLCEIESYKLEKM